MKGQKLAMGLGWFSLGLGLYELLAPEHLSRVLGLEGREGLLRFYGLREIGAGLGIFLTQPNPAPWVWGRGRGRRPRSGDAGHGAEAGQSEAGQCRPRARVGRGRHRA